MLQGQPHNPVIFKVPNSGFAATEKLADCSKSSWSLRSLLNSSKLLRSLRCCWSSWSWWSLRSWWRYRSSWNKWWWSSWSLWSSWTFQKKIILKVKLKYFCTLIKSCPRISLQNTTGKAVQKTFYKDLAGTLKYYLMPVSTLSKELFSQDHLSFYWVSGVLSYTCAMEIPTFFTSFNRSQNRRRVKISKTGLLSSDWLK